MSDIKENVSGGDTQQNGNLETKPSEKGNFSNETTNLQNGDSVANGMSKREAFPNDEQNGHVAEKSTKSDKEETEVMQRSFLQRHAFVITLIAYNMIHGLMWAVKSQYRYTFFHDLHADELKQFNITRECGAVLESDVQAVEDKISAETANWSLYGSYIRTPLTIIACFVIGMKSDQIGRRTVFLMPFVTSITDCIIMAVVIRLNLHYGYMLIGDFVYGMSGMSAGMSLASFALVSDTHGKKKPTTASPSDTTTTTTTTDEKNLGNTGHSSTSDEIDLDMSREKSRTFKLVLLHIVPSLAASIVSFVEGYIIAYLGFFWTIIIVIGIKGAFFIFGIAFVTETGEQKKNIEFTGPLKTIGRAFKDPVRRVPLLLVNLALLFSVLASVEEREIIHTYEMSPPFCLRSIQLGWLSAEGRLKGLFGIPLMWVWRRLRMSESTIAGIGVTSNTVGALLLATIRETWVFFANLAIAIPGSLSSSMTRAITSRLIGRSALASTFALMLAGEELFVFVGGTASNYLYQYTLGVLPTAPFYLSAGSFAVATILYFGQTVYQRRSGDVAGADATLTIQTSNTQKA